MVKLSAINRKKQNLYRLSANGDHQIVAPKPLIVYFERLRIIGEPSRL